MQRHISVDNQSYPVDYRPTGDEAEAALEETRSVLLSLSQRLGLYDDINWYRAVKNRDDS